MKKLLPFLAVLTLSAQLKTFDTPEAAAQAVIAAAEKNDVAALNAIFGANSKAILTSGDPKQDAQERAEFARVARAKYQIEKDPMNLHRVMLDVGPENWPFPVPIVEKDGKWSFEPAQGELEVRARRIGANEIDVIDMSAGFVQAQQQYAEADRDKDGILEYAEFLMSEPGKEDGLYAASSPLIPKALAEAEVRPGRAKPVPYHGYYFHILTSQLASDRGGTHVNYLVQGKHMMGGFALVAWPSQYGVTGIHTFVVNKDGIVYEKDLGTPASNLTPPVKTYAPDKTWTRVDEE
ncbi:MAG TPA: DUF2950 family protein [Bryobacteraceae bacterium]|nr:DUF2950 family protein [Bryobacteraceae bacterium]